MNLREYESFILTNRNVEWVAGLFGLLFDICVCGFFLFTIVMFFIFASFAIKESFDDYKRKKILKRKHEEYILNSLDKQ